MIKNFNIILVFLALLQLLCHPESKEESFIERPKLLSTQELLIYPAAAFEQGLQGKTVIRIFVNKDGQVSEAKILKSSGSNILDDAALKMVRSSVYEPGSIDGVISGFWLHIPVQFNLSGNIELRSDIDEWIELTLLYQVNIESVSSVYKSDIYKNLYYHYQSLALEIRNTRSIEANPGILTVVHGSLGEQWIEYKDIWPLGFLLFQDFIQRYPQNEFSLKSRVELIRYFQGEIDILEQKSISNPPNSIIYSLILESLKKLYDQDIFK
jgi:TonB family protein